MLGPPLFGLWWLMAPYWTSAGILSTSIWVGWVIFLFFGFVFSTYGIIKWLWTLSPIASLIAMSALIAFPLFVLGPAYISWITFETEIHTPTPMQIKYIGMGFWLLLVLLYIEYLILRDLYRRIRTAMKFSKLNKK